MEKKYFAHEKLNTKKPFTQTNDDYGNVYFLNKEDEEEDGLYFEITEDYASALKLSINYQPSEPTPIPALVCPNQKSDK